jgi:hypothetical protein
LDGNFGVEVLLRVTVVLINLKKEESNPRDAACGKLTLMITWSTPLLVTFEIPAPVKVTDWDL